MELIKKVFTLECQLTEQESTHHMEMDWLKDMYLFEAEQREAMKIHFSVIKDLLVAEKQKTACLEAKIESLEAERTSAVMEKNKYKKAYSEVMNIADILVEDAESKINRKDEDEENLFLLLEKTLEEANQPTVSVSTSTENNNFAARPSRRISWLQKRIWRKLNIPSLSRFLKTLLF